MALQDHVAAVVNDALYLIGGQTQPNASMAPSADVWRAPFTADGKLGPFMKAGALVAGLYWASAFVFLDQISVLGGEQEDLIVTATVRADGTVGAFDRSSTLPTTRWSAGPVPVHAGFVYSAGGSGGAAGDGARVFVGKLN